MSVYETAKKHFRALRKMSVGPLPVKTDDKKIIFSPAAKGPAMDFFNMLPHSMEKEHGNWESVERKGKDNTMYTIVFLVSAFDICVGDTGDAALAYALENEKMMRPLEYTAAELE